MRNLLIILSLGLLLGACSSTEHKSNADSNTKEPSNDKNTFLDINASVKIYTTAEKTNLRLSSGIEKSFKKTAQPKETDISIFVNPQKTFQEFMGIGGAITDASAEVFALLSDEKQRELLKAYYSVDEGIGYTLARTNIHSCDFSKGSYTYVSDEDKELKTFDISHDLDLRIPLIKRATQAAGGKLPMYASPWSPPAFMKSNKNMLHGGSLLEEYFDSWALYYTKFIKAYEKEGIPIWGLSIQNEPMATQIWESCIYTAEQERDFLKNHLGPTMEKEGLGDKKIIVWDHNRDLISHRANTIFEDPEASKYAWGIGFHWYETWTGGEPMFDNLANIHESFPDKKLIFTEGCSESFNAEHYEYWPNAERYGRSMINDFNCGTVAWTDWNILLDETGGPNHVGNLCFAPVHANTNTGDIIYTPSYYYIGHFSKFVRPGAKRVSTTSSRSVLLSTSFRNVDGSMVSVVLNLTDDNIKYKLFVGNEAVEQEILAHSMQTLIY